MKAALFICSILLSGATLVASAGDIDYSQGVFIVNEDWYGHQNSTVNYLLPDDPSGEYWHYRVIQAENPGKELGCTNQYGAIWNGRFYFIAKQAKDPGADIKGGRITVADASTMNILHQSELIDPSGSKCDGRGFIGVDEHKGYISTSNGVWILDLDAYQVKGPIEGTANPDAGNLYKGQCGSMVESGGRIFVAHQSLGVLVIDPATDSVTATIGMDCVNETAGIGSVVRARDGSVWASVARNTSGQGQTMPCLIRIDPSTLTTETIDVPDGMYAPSNSWYAWTPDSFCASSVSDCLYWSGSANTWFSGQNIYRFDTVSRQTERIIDLSADGENWKLYGCSIRVHPVTDEIYMSLYHDFSDPSYITRRYTPSGEKIRDYEMISNYWFPSIPVFPGRRTESISHAATDKPIRVWTEPGAIHVEGSDTFEVYDTSGRLCSPARLSPGIYIVVTPHSSHKVFVK